MLEEEELKSAILVVLANKQDIEGAMSVTEVSWLYLIVWDEGNFWSEQRPTIFAFGKSLDEGLEWPDP
jgi:hypothetical protein